MAVDTFIPEVWNATLQTTLARKYVFAAPDVVNRDYEGDIAEAGDTVHIGALTDPTVSTYTKNVTVIDPQTLATTEQMLVIDQSKYFAFEVDDVDKRQARGGGALLTTAAQRAAVKMASLVDTFVSTLMTAGAGTVLPAADIATPQGAFSLIVRMRMALNKLDVPAEGRFLIVSPEFGALLLGDQRFTSSDYGNGQAVQNGEIGRALGFAIKESNTIPAGTAGTPPEVSNYVVAGHPMATTFADQINKTEAYRPQSSFSDAIKGLHLYGGKVVRPEALVACDVDVTVPATL